MYIYMCSSTYHYEFGGSIPQGAQLTIDTHDVVLWHLARQPKIADFQRQVAEDEDVGGFQILMCNAHAVDVGHPRANTMREHLHRIVRQILLLLDQLIQVGRGCWHYVNLRIFVAAEHWNHVGVLSDEFHQLHLGLHCSQHVRVRHPPSAGTAEAELVLRLDDFNRHGLVASQTSATVDHCEGTLANLGADLPTQAQQSVSIPLFYPI